GGTPDRPVTFTTNAAGQQLALLSDGKLKLFAFKRYGPSLMEHPKNKNYKIESIQILTGTPHTAAVNGCDAPTTGPNANTLVCTCGNNDSECGILIHYCSSTASSTGCM